METLTIKSFQKFCSCLAVIMLCIISLVSAQTRLYDYQDLSHVYNKKQKDSLKKFWICPQVYQNKETQKKYKEFWDSRTEFITNALEAKCYVHEKEVYNYISGILNDLVVANKAYIKEAPVLFIDRSSAANAYAIGGNMISVNLGLITFARYREDIAMVVAHELSHNILNHADNAIKERAEWFTSEEYKTSLKSVLDSRYERLTRLKKVLEGYSFNRSKHQRYKEGDADSLAIVLLKNAKIDFDASFFLRLDSSDMQYKQPLKNPVKTYFAGYNLPFEDNWTQKRSKGLSTRSYNFKDTSGIEDSLKTHPDCKERYAKATKHSTPNGHHTLIPAAISDKANKMIIWNMFDNRALTACLYRVMREKDKGNKDEWYDFMVYSIFSGLYFSDRELERFNAIGIMPKEFISKDYYELQNMLEQMPRETLEHYCKNLVNEGFWQKMGSDANGLKSLFHTLNFNNDTYDKSRDAAARDYSNTYSSSMYCEFADHFKKK